MRTLLVCGIFLIGALAAHADSASDKQKAQTCSACHGPSGISANDLWPNLAGQKKSYLIQQLEAFRRGDRHDPLMTPVSQTLSDQDIKDLAAYFSALKGGS